MPLTDFRAVGRFPRVLRTSKDLSLILYRVSFLSGIAVLMEKIGGIAVLSFYRAVCGIVIY